MVLDCFSIVLRRAAWALDVMESASSRITILKGGQGLPLCVCVCVCVCACVCGYQVEVSSYYLTVPLWMLLLADSPKNEVEPGIYTRFYLVFLKGRA